MHLLMKYFCSLKAKRKKKTGSFVFAIEPQKNYARDQRRSYTNTPTAWTGMGKRKLADRKRSHRPRRTRRQNKRTKGDTVLVRLSGTCRMEQYDYAQAYLNECTSLGLGRQEEEVHEESGNAYPKEFYERTLALLPFKFGDAEYTPRDDIINRDRVFRLVHDGPPTRDLLRRQAEFIFDNGGCGLRPDLFALLPAELLQIILTLIRSPLIMRSVCLTWRDAQDEMCLIRRNETHRIVARALASVLQIAGRITDYEIPTAYPELLFGTGGCDMAVPSAEGRFFFFGSGGHRRRHHSV